MHHTWKPAQSEYRGHETIVSIWRFHTENNHWSDIAQHITIAPDGTIWLGRNWNLPPASAVGHNGNTILGPFMFETIGDFDLGHDVLAGAQRSAVVRVIAAVQQKFGLHAETLVFHNAMSTKTCPGSGVRRDEIVAEVSRAREAPRSRSARARVPMDGPFPENAYEESHIIDEAIRSLSRAPVEYREEPNAEHLGHGEAEIPGSEAREAAARGDEITPAMLEEMRPHLIDMTMGQLSSDGVFKSSAGDVDAIFEEHLPKALAGARERGEKLRLLFWAHGDLVKETDGLRIAHNHIGWWIANKVYPIYFIWQTGAFETIGQLLARAQQGAARALPRDIFDHTTDLIIEETTRALQGPSIWGGMKFSAELASRPGEAGQRDGGALYAARKLAAFCAGHEAELEIHAVGHSAGSIFHCYFVPAALEAGVARFASVQFLAPAVRVDTFRQRLFPLVGAAIERLAIFTMSKSFERADNCAFVYRKSLLYLISNALEAERNAAILGLEESIRADEDLKRLLGVAAPGAPGEIVWSPSVSDSGRSASRSTTHGGFDDDAATMGSVARRVLGKADADEIVPYPATPGDSRGASAWIDQVDWPDFLRGAPGQSAASLSLGGAAFRPANQGAGPGNARPGISPGNPGGNPGGTVASGAVTAPAGGWPGSAIGGRTGDRKALCVGINRYPTAPLSGCVDDAQAWARTLAGLGFEQPILLLDEAATRAAMTAALRQLVSTSRPGDVVAFQYSGHGTQLPDLNGDEAAGNSPGLDEAICPYDFASGAFLIDDDVGAILSTAPAGVDITLFIDCCHSGTISRFAVGTAPGAANPRLDERPRFINATPAMIEAHRRFREGIGASRAATSGGPELMPEILFSACLPNEVAWESGGHGEFTIRALEVLASAAGLTNEQFEQHVTDLFGANPRQHVRLYCADSKRSAALLQPARSIASNPALTGSIVPGRVPTRAASPATHGDRDSQVLAVLESIQGLIQQLRH